MYSIQEGNAALPRKLAAAAKLQALHLGTAVQAVRRDTTTGQYTLLASKAVQATADHPCSDPARSAAATQTEDKEEAPPISQHDQQQAKQHIGQQSTDEYGPFDGVVLATPLEGSAIELQGVLPPGAVLPKREYQSTVTTYVTGALNPSYFKVRCGIGCCLDNAAAKLLNACNVSRKHFVGEVVVVLLLRLLCLLPLSCSSCGTHCRCHPCPLVTSSSPAQLTPYSQ